jgi:hypothetical protein
MARETLKSTVNTVNVSSVDEYAKKIVDAGGKILAPKTPIRGVGKSIASTPKGTPSESWRTTPRLARSVGGHRGGSALASGGLQFLGVSRIIAKNGTLESVYV